MRKLLLVIALIFLASGIAGARFYWNNLRGIGPAVQKPPQDIVDIIEDRENDVPVPQPPVPGENNTEFPLTMPDGFDISIYAKDIPGARVIAFDEKGNMWVSQISEGTITIVEKGSNGKAGGQRIVFSDLQKPHGLAFDPQDPNVLFIAEENKVSRVTVRPEIGTLQKLIDLPEGSLHASRTINFGPDGRLYVAIGSSCNACEEEDPLRAKIYVMDKDGSNFKEFARGLRNTVFFTWHPGTKQMWGTDMGRDLLGDDVPPDELNIIEEGKNYGWPTCYGNNIHDTDYDKNVYIRNPCMEPFETPAYVEFQAHSAPLGLAFVPPSWPQEYRDNLIVAFHGSWNRTEPTGYKLVRIKLHPNGAYLGQEDFISGWLTDDGALGRPVDVVFGPDNQLYVSDDKAGVVYRISSQQ